MKVPMTFLGQLPYQLVLLFYQVTPTPTPDPYPYPNPNPSPNSYP